MIREEMARSNASGRFRLNFIPQHTHNGTDSPNILEDNIVLTRKIYSQIDVRDASGAANQETVTLRNVNNVSRISFHGFAANNATGSATIRSSVTGEAIFGSCQLFTGDGANISVTSTPTGNPFIQACNYITVDSNSPSNNAVGSAPYLAYAADQSNNYTAIINLDSVTIDSIQLTFVVISAWRIQGLIIIE